MRRFLNAIVYVGLVCVCAAATRAAEPTFPYKAFINTEEVYVRSGPGQNYYPTDKLAVGQEVEVYRHDPGGWYAIRPGSGSFCWLNTRYLEFKGDGLAVVTDDDVAARIGSRFSDVRDVIQVRLKRGEVVELLDERAARSGQNPWCRILPPSGEFRWVFGKYVDPEYPRDGLSKPRPADGQAAAAPAAEPRDAPPAVATLPRRLNPEQFKAEIDATEVELAIMLVEEPTVWSFGSLRQRAESLLGQAETAVERGHARVLLNKIERFAGIKQRYDTVHSVREETERANRLLSGVTTAARNNLPPLDERDSRYDGVGRLTELSDPPPGAPRYALLDGRGELKWYVTPAPGVNLRHYLGRQVGVSGARGYIPEKKAHHLMARQVSPLEDGALR
jgi:hypothetical protein